MGVLSSGSSVKQGPTNLGASCSHSILQDTQKGIAKQQKATEKGSKGQGPCPTFVSKRASSHNCKSSAVGRLLCTVVTQHRRRCWDGEGADRIGLLQVSLFRRSRELRLSSILYAWADFLLDHPVGGHLATTINCDMYSKSSEFSTTTV